MSNTNRTAGWAGGASLIALVLGASLALPNLAYAQEEPSEGAGQDIIVTGSRVARTSFNSPTPVNTVGAERLEETGLSNIADALNQLPSFRAVTTPTTTLYRTSGNTSARTMDLRGLGASRTLVLVNGRRFVPSSELGTVDINAIPSSMIERAEVVTGGASAAYGADAVAGVVNLILDTDLEGFKSDLSYSVTDVGDAQSYFASLAGGTGFAGGRGHVVFGLEYGDEKAAGDCYTRDWCTDANLLSNPDFPNNGLPATLLLDNAWNILNRGGVVPSGPLRGIQFDAQGNPIPFQFGDLVSGAIMIGGDASVGRSLLTEGSPLKTPVTHLSEFTHASYDFSDTLRGVFELSFSRVEGRAQASDAWDFNRSISIENPYLAPETVQMMVDAGVTSIPVNRLSSELGKQRRGHSTTDTMRVMLGLEGSVFDDWSWDAYYQYGRTTGDLEVTHSRNAGRWTQAIDAVRAPDGAIVCRSTLTDPTNGCIPFNFIGEGNGSQASAAWVSGTQTQTREITQQVIAANLRGSLGATWAGPISVAAGAEYREDSAEGDADEISRAQGWWTTLATYLPHIEQNVSEGYLEASVPLLKDSEFGKSLEVDGAVRRTEYSEAGGATTWKVGLVYQPVDDIMFRVTRSADIRAPSALELSPSTIEQALPINDPELNSTYYAVLASGGNPNLSLEEADTTTYGVVLQPRWIPNFRLSVDYYNIEVDNAIDVLAGQTTINLCSAGNATLCGFIDRDSDGFITRVLSTYQNLSVLKSEGMEIVSDYYIPLQDVASWLDGSVNVSFNATYTEELSTLSATGSRIEYSGWTGNPGTIQNVFGVPKWRWDALITYELDRYAVSAHGRYVGDGVYDPTKVGPGQEGYDVTAPNSINYNDVDSRFYIDLSGKIELASGGDHGVELYGSILNLMDRDPPYLRLYGNPMLFDNLGRTYRIGVRATW